MDKKREISEKNLIDFLIAAFSQFQIKATNQAIADLVHCIHQCYDDDMMFDSWFLGVDVMN